VRARHAATVAREVERLLDALPTAGPVDLREALTAPLAAATMVDALALDAPVSEVLAIYETIVAAVSGLAAGAEPPAAAAAAMADLARLVARPEHLSDIAVLLFGGIETTDGMIANALLHLLSTPGAVAAVLADGSLLGGAVEESLRLEPAAAVVDRYATRDVLLGDVAIPQGSLVTVSIAAANRDPATFPDPDRFDLTRDNARLHLAFAQGPHVCLGMHLARLEAHAAVAAALRRFPSMALDPARPSAPRGLVFRKPPTLFVLPGARQ
jgi:cytochrome P450